MKRSTILAAFLVLATVLVVDAFSQHGGGESTYQVGQRVEANWPPGWQEAEVTEVRQDGWLVVRLAGDRRLALPPDRIRPLSGQASGPGTGRDRMGDGFGRASSGEDSFKVGDRVEVDFAGWQQGVVIEIWPNGWIKVRLSDGMGEPVLPPRDFRHIGEADSRSRPPASRLRTWTDSTGKFRVQATFVTRDGDQVTIEQAGGKQVTLPFAKLSHSDQVYVTSVSPPGPGGSYPGDVLANDSSAGTTAFDASTAKVITLADPGTIPVTPDGVLEPNSLTKKPISLLGDGGADRRERFETMQATEAVVFHRPTSRVFMTVSGSDGSYGGASQVMCIDLKEGKVLGRMPLPEMTYVSDVSPNGKRMLVQGGFANRQDGRVSLWELGGNPKEAVAWQPYSTLLKSVDMMAFLDDHRVVTAGGEGSLVLWDTAEKNAIYSVPMFRTTVPALSPGRKQIALATEQGIFLLDSNSGTPLTMLPGEPTYRMRFSFCSDGRQLAAASPTRLQVWDLEQATRVRDIHFPSSLHLESLEWVGPGHVLISGTELVDLERRVVLWRYRWEGRRATGIALAGLYWTTLPGMLIAMKLPHPEAEQTGKALNPDKILALKPGSTVGIQVTASVSAEERRIIYDALTRRLEKNGIRVADGSKLVLRAETGQGGTEQVSYGSRPLRGDAGTATVTKQISKLTISENGNVLWTAQQVKGAPMFVSRKEGESLDSAIAAKLKPTVDFFVNTPLPQYLARHGKQGIYGQSMVTDRGIVSYDPETGQVDPRSMMPPRR